MNSIRILATQLIAKATYPIIMGWVAGEFSRRRPARSDQTPDLAQLQAVENAWLELRDGLQTDVNEYNRWGGAALFDAPGGEQTMITEPGTALQVRVQADLPNRHLRYEFQSLREDVPAPEGGFLSIRISPAG